MEIKGEKNEFQSDGTGNHYQNGIDLGVLEVQVMRFLIKNALWLCAELCLLPGRGAHFRKIMKTLSENEMMSKSLDGKCDGYMRGRDGA